MMTKEEAYRYIDNLKWLKGYDNTTIGGKTVGEILDEIKTLLKEQEAKTPIVRENSYGWKFYYCPRCEKEFYQNRKQAFCDKCGQAVKWK